jgi:hypothetical protein
VNNKPLFTSDELIHYRTVLQENFSKEASLSLQEASVVLPAKVTEL